MPDETRYLLGKGERLTQSVVVPRGFGGKAHPYGWVEQRDRLAPRIVKVAEALDALPAAACPEDRAVAALTLHPSYLAKTYYPQDLLRNAGLRPLGSRPRFIQPEKGNAGMSTEFFVAGKREVFRRWAQVFPNIRPDATDILPVEDFRAIPAEERLRVQGHLEHTATFEVVLHAPSDWESVVDGFDEYALDLDATVDAQRRHYIGNLAFMPVRATALQISRLAEYSFVRVTRVMPRLRQMSPDLEHGEEQRRPIYSLPVATPAIDRTIRVAVFDGGIEAGSPVLPWVRSRPTSNLGASHPGLLRHGTNVTAAALFGSLSPGESYAPYAEIDHYRVLDTASLGDSGEYYDVLDRIVEVLEQEHYDFVNLSIGPDFAIEDDDIHPWTAKLDEVLNSGKTLLISAAGNKGHLDREAGLSRIQPPADGVNILSVGAHIASENGWVRAEYSCVGPGRSPGVVKPDVMAFGGSEEQPFWVPSAQVSGLAVATCGTSFSAPTVLRLATAVRAHFGDSITPLGIRTLLVHHADPATHELGDVGWGAVPPLLQALVTCEPGTVHVLYQGIMQPRQDLRCEIPLPEERIPGMVNLRATFCFATATDPEDPFNYTRAGLIPTFRPDITKRTPRTDPRTQEERVPIHADSASFFTAHDHLDETHLRNDAQKWETVLKKEKRFRGSTLNGPVFDVHYNPREGGGEAREPRAIPYALVISVHAASLPDIYDQVAIRYRTRLESIQPVIAIPVRV